jgi:hypothetical protein
MYVLATCSFENRPQVLAGLFLKNEKISLSDIVEKSITFLEQESQKRPFPIGIIPSHFSWQGTLIEIWYFLEKIITLKSAKTVF